MNLTERFITIILFCLYVVSCTHGPVERRVVIEQVVQIEDSYTAFALVQSELFRKPTGIINTFPNGGVYWVLSQQVKVYELNAWERKARFMAELPADNATWVSFSAHISGLDDQNNLYVQLTGCEKGGECYPPLYNHKYFLLNREGILVPLSGFPSNTSLPGNMVARRQGEVSYVRYSIRGDTIKAKFQENGDYRSIFITEEQGNLVTYK